MATLTEEIARRIEAELQYPGQIKVVLIRETRAVDFARWSDRRSCDSKACREAGMYSMPLPSQINPDAVVRRADTSRDVEGFHPVNVGKVLIGERHRGAIRRPDRRPRLDVHPERPDDQPRVGPHRPQEEFTQADHLAPGQRDREWATERDELSERARGTRQASIRISPSAADVGARPSPLLDAADPAERVRDPWSAVR